MKRKTTKTAPAAEPVAVATQSANVAPEEGDLAEGDPSKKGTAASKKAAKPTAKPATKAGEKASRSHESLGGRT